MPIAPTHPHPAAAAYRAAGHWGAAAVGDGFARTVARQAARIAIVDGDRRLSFADLDAASRRAARGLQALGLGPGDIVAYQLPNWWETVLVFLAAARLGVTVNPLLPTFRAAELRFTLRQSGAAALFIPAVYRSCDHRALVQELRGDCPALREVVVVRGESLPGLRRFEDLLATPAECGLSHGAAFETPPDEGGSSGRTVGDIVAADPAVRPEEAALPAGPSRRAPSTPPAVDPDSLLLLMYTSGTSAAPKGVLHTHNTLVAEVRSLERVHQLTPADRTLMPSPLTHISGVIHGILTPALLGTSAVLMDRWEAARALELIDAEGVTYMVGAPTFLQDLMAQAEGSGRRAETLRLFSCGGAGVSPALVAQARARFPGCVAKRVYGSTEFPTLTTTDAADALTHGIDTEGRAIWPAEVRITDADGRAVPAGTEGEVQGRGPECCVGYADARLNAEAFTSDGWFRTGDCGVLDAAGYLRITGRLKDIVVRKGEKISVKEVEDAIAAHPAVAEVAVIALPDAQTGERACAVVRLRSGETLDLDALRARLAAQGLAKQKWPESLHVVDEFPRTDSGKIARAELRNRLAASGRS